jgi:hypothetical protein
MAVAGDQPTAAAQHHRDAVGVTALHLADPVMGSADGCTRCAGDVDGGMAWANPLRDDSRDRLQQLQDREEQGDGQRVFRLKIEANLGCDRLDPG